MSADVEKVMKGVDGWAGEMTWCKAINANRIALGEDIK